MGPGFVTALRTLVTSIFHTLKSLFWALVLLFLIVYVFANLFSSAVHDHMANETTPFSEEEKEAGNRLGVLLEVYTVGRQTSSSLCDLMWVPKV